MNEGVMIVDRDDRMYGTMDKLAAHKAGVLHRAFSVFIFNSKGELFLQQRAEGKYHSGGLWTNTCCSHPRPGEASLDGANRRLQEEMGMSCKLHFVFSFYYQAKVSQSLTEHEFDHVYFGISDDQPIPNEEEVSAFKYMAMDELARELKDNPALYTSWLIICFDKVITNYKNLFKNEPLAD